MVRRSASAQFHDSRRTSVAQRLGDWLLQRRVRRSGIICPATALRVEAANMVSSLRFDKERGFFRSNGLWPDQFSAVQQRRLAEFLLQRD
jgi:hypothetical protein